ncbi:hypothetical protein PTKIN_Ptkin13bG0216500 [Pterospermum kingtungense]
MEVKYGVINVTSLQNVDIAMYGKFGMVEDSERMLYLLSKGNLICWTALISGYVRSGCGEKAVDTRYILGITQRRNLLGFSQGKTVLLLFDMKGEEGQGALHKAMNFINNRPIPDSPLPWRTLVSVCKLQEDLEFGMLASKKLPDLSPEEAGSCMPVSKTSAGSGLLDEAEKFRTTMNDLKLDKVAGCSWIETDNKVHCFVASGKDLPESREIYAKVGSINR